MIEDQLYRKVLSKLDNTCKSECYEIDSEAIWGSVASELRRVAYELCFGDPCEDETRLADEYRQTTTSERYAKSISEKLVRQGALTRFEHCHRAFWIHADRVRQLIERNSPEWSIELRTPVWRSILQRDDADGQVPETSWSRYKKKFVWHEQGTNQNGRVELRGLTDRQLERYETHVKLYMPLANPRTSQ